MHTRPTSAAQFQECRWRRRQSTVKGRVVARVWLITAAARERYSVHLTDAQGRRHEVKVDAGNAQVLQVEDADNERQGGNRD